MLSELEVKVFCAHLALSYNLQFKLQIIFLQQGHSSQGHLSVSFSYVSYEVSKRLNVILVTVFHQNVMK